jgi:hypothetical protein
MRIVKIFLLSMLLAVLGACGNPPQNHMEMQHRLNHIRSQGGYTRDAYRVQQNLNHVYSRGYFLPGEDFFIRKDIARLQYLVRYQPSPHRHLAKNGWFR